MKVILEKEAEDFLETRRFHIVKRKFIKNKSELPKIKIKFPWVIKVSSKKAIHKASHGGVKTNIQNLHEAEQAFAKLKKIPGFQGALVQKTIKGQHLILGLKKTPEFGHAILLGAGGSDVEELKDTSFRICPITKKDIKEMIKEIKINVLNPKQIEKNLLKLSKLALQNSSIQELDINPLIVNKKQATIVDVRIIK